MDNYTYIHDNPPELAAQHLCTLMEKIEDYTQESCCDLCPVNALCSPGHNGFEEWLRKEINHDKRTD